MSKIQKNINIILDSLKKNFFGCGIKAYLFLRQIMNNIHVQKSQYKIHPQIDKLSATHDLRMNQQMTM